MSEQQSNGAQQAGAGLARRTEVLNEADRLLAEGDAHAAVEQLEAGRALAGQDPTGRSAFVFVLVRAYCLAGRVDAAVHALREGLDAQGVFWSPRLLAEFPGIGELLSAHPDFEGLMALAHERWAAAQNLTTRLDPVVKLPKTPARGVVYVWHGATAEPEEFARLWSAPARQAELALVVPRGPLLTCPGLFGWELENTRGPVLAAHEAAIRHGLGDLPKVFAGFCMGASIAIAESLADTEHDLRPRGLVAIAPPYVAPTGAGLARAAQNDFRISVVRGEWDWFAEQTDGFVARLQAAGANPQVAEMPRVGHSVSRFRRYGTDALSFAFGD